VHENVDVSIELQKKNRNHNNVSLTTPYIPIKLLKEGRVL